MRGFIAFILLFATMTYFAWQPLQQQLNDEKGLVVENVVHSALEEAKIKGYFTAGDLSNIQTAVASDIGYPLSAVTVTGTTTPQTRGNFLSLQVSVPTRLNFVNLWFGQNTTTITRSESAMSEAIQ